MRVLTALLSLLLIAADEPPRKADLGPLAKYAPKTLSPYKDEKDILKFCMAYRDRELMKIPAIASGQTAYTSDGAETKYYDACLRAHELREN